MTTAQLETKLQIAKDMLAYCTSRLNPLLADSDPVNALLLNNVYQYQGEVDRISRTLEVRQCAAGIQRE